MPDLQNGRVIRIDSASCIVLDDRGQKTRCFITGHLKEFDTGQTNPVAVGDFVTFETENTGEGVVKNIQERKHVLSRSSTAKPGHEQVIVSNVDQILIVASITKPPLRTTLIDRIMVAAEYSEIKPIIAITKIDLVSNKPGKYMQHIDMYRSIGYNAIPVSSITKQGVNEIKELLKDKTTVLSGHSGVGKSSLLNRVDPNLHLKTGQISHKTTKGSHTTTHVELFSLTMGGVVIDTPGIRSFSIWNVPEEDLDYYFKELRPLRDNCRFGANCSHQHEPDCAILKALENNHIHPKRYESYLKILENSNERY